MKFLYSVQRYGRDIVGGSEMACRLFAENLVGHGHEVTVVTSCALNYTDWSDHYEPGESIENGVRVVRLPVIRPRDPEKFARLAERVLAEPTRTNYADQIRWLQDMGPVLRDHDRTLRREAARSDAAIFMTYLYPTSVFGIASVVDVAPIILQPTAHEEPPAHLSIYRALFQWADGYLFLTEEEREISRRIFHLKSGGTVTGIGMDVRSGKGHGASFREIHGLGDDPFILYLGRIDVYKGVSELMRYFVEYKGRNPSKLRLVLAGEAVMPLPEVDDIRFLGFLDEQSKIDAIAASDLLVQSSPFESFSIVLCEAWLQGKPVLVQGRSEVLTGQSLRSGGGIPYRGFAEFEAALDKLRGDQSLASEMGAHGREYVVSSYDWDSVLDRFMYEINAARERFAVRREAAITSPQ